jgi:hypothetical protein
MKHPQVVNWFESRMCWETHADIHDCILREPHCTLYPLTVANVTVARVPPRPPSPWPHRRFQSEPCSCGHALPGHPSPASLAGPHRRLKSASATGSVLAHTGRPWEGRGRHGEHAIAAVPGVSGRTVQCWPDTDLGRAYAGDELSSVCLPRDDENIGWRRHLLRVLPTTPAGRSVSSAGAKLGPRGGVRGPIFDHDLEDRSEFVSVDDLTFITIFA